MSSIENISKKGLSIRTKEISKERFYISTRKTLNSTLINSTTLNSALLNPTILILNSIITIRYTLVEEVIYDRLIELEPLTI